MQDEGFWKERLASKARTKPRRMTTRSKSRNWGGRGERGRRRERTKRARNGWWSKGIVGRQKNVQVVLILLPRTDGVRRRLYVTNWNKTEGGGNLSHGTIIITRQGVRKKGSAKEGTNRVRRS